MLKSTSDVLTNQANFSGAIYYYTTVAAMILGGIGWLIRHFHQMDSRMRRVEYALYNDGKTGLINKVDSLIENQQCIKVDVEVMKAKIGE
jgi:hypothetical protein